METSISFFDQRDQVIDQYGELGYIDINEFLTETGLSVKLLIASGVVYKNLSSSLADLHDLLITKQGHSFLCEVSSHQLILVKPDCYESLLFYIENARDRLALISGLSLAANA